LFQNLFEINKGFQTSREWCQSNRREKMGDRKASPLFGWLCGPLVAYLGQQTISLRSPKGHLKATQVGNGLEPPFGSLTKGRWRPSGSRPRGGAVAKEGQPFPLPKVFPSLLLYKPIPSSLSGQHNCPCGSLSFSHVRGFLHDLRLHYFH
jgi:hypothetical protein